MRDTNINRVDRLSDRIQARCEQVRSNWSQSERAVRRLWAQMAQRRLLAASHVDEPVQ